MAQKKLSDPSGLTLWIERTKYSPPTLTSTGCEAKEKASSVVVEDAADARVFLGRRLGVELLDDPTLGVGLGDHHLDRGRIVIVVAEGLERQVGRHQRQHRRVRIGLAAVDDEGALEPEAVAGRAADDRNVVERHLERRDDRLLPPAHAVDEQKAEPALARESRPQRVEIGAQPLGQLAPRLDMEIGQIEDRPGDEGEVAAQESRSRQPRPRSTLRA